jgi:hypothetical protein
MTFATALVLMVTGASRQPYAAESQLQAPEGQGFTAAVLYDECTNYSDSSIQRAHCNGFVHGVLEGTLIMGEVVNQGPVFCGGSPSVAELVTIFQTYVRRHPNAPPHKAGDVVAAAFVSAFPCEETK